MDKRVMNITRLELLARPAPCDGCEHNTKCALDLKACRSFQHYVHGGVVSKNFSRVPTRSIFNEVFYEDDDKTFAQLRKDLREQLRREEL